MIDLELDLRGALAETATAISPDPAAWDTFQLNRPHRRARRRLVVGLSIAGIVAATAGIVAGAFAITDGATKHHEAPSTTDRIRHGVLFPYFKQTPHALDRAASILQGRIADLGFPGALIHHTGDGLEIAGTTAALTAIYATAETRGVLQVRRALGVGAGLGARPHPSAAVQGKSTAVTPKFSNAFEHWNCPSRTFPTHGALDTTNLYIISCSRDGQSRYLLAPSAVKPGQLRSAKAAQLSPAATGWAVDVGLTSAGAEAFQTVIRQASHVAPGQRRPVCLPAGCNAVAYVVDGIVKDAPSALMAQNVAGSQIQIGPGLTRRAAVQLAAVLDQPPLPTIFLQPPPP